MMGQHEGQKDLFSYHVDLDRRLHADHPLHRVHTMVDFTFARAAVAHTYGANGNVSVDPAVLVNLMFLLFSENVRSERELMRRLPERLDWLWFLGYGLEDPVPNHSVLSKARERWGGDLFEELFVRTVRQCVEAGLVDGTKVHVDGSLIDADASRDSVIKADAATIARIKAAYGVQQRKLDETKPPSARCETNHHLVSTTDPDAPCVSKGPQSGTARPRYKHHRMIDDRHGVITAVATTTGDVSEPEQVQPQADRRRRRHLMEGSFAHAANRYHFKRSRWRRLWRQRVQDWIIAAVQNIALLCGQTGAAIGAKLPNCPKNGGGRPGFLFCPAPSIYAPRKPLTICQLTLWQSLLRV